MQDRQCDGQLNRNHADVLATTLRNHSQERRCSRGTAIVRLWGNAGIQPPRQLGLWVTEMRYVELP